MDNTTQKLQNLFLPSTLLFLLLMAVFTVVSFFYNETLTVLLGSATLVMGVYVIFEFRRRRDRLYDYIRAIQYDAESAKNNTLSNIPLPVAAFSMEDSKIIWGNNVFLDLFGEDKLVADIRLSDLIRGFNTQWLNEGKKQYPETVQIGERKFLLHGNVVRPRDELSSEHAPRSFMGITYWLDVTELDRIRTEYESSRPVTMLLVVDNYDELMKNLPERGKTELRSHIDDKIAQWCEGKQGFARFVDRDRYLFMFESRYLEPIIMGKFDILEQVHDIVSPSGIQATLSIGVGLDGTFEENFSSASLCVEMALSRGGDQAVVKSHYDDFQFFGGRGTEVGIRSSVKSRVTANALSELICASSQVMIMGHKLADMDAIGAAVGVRCICRKLEVPSKIVVEPEKNASHKLIDRLRETDEYRDAFLSPDEAMLRADSKTLLIVVDTNRPEQVDSQPLLESCTRVAVIDHHRRAASYIQNPALTFHEPRASSACELVTELVQNLVEPREVLHVEAEALLAGLILDTKSFAIRTGEKTFDAAAFLRRLGADTMEIKKLLQSDMEHTVEKYGILQGAKIYRDGIAIAACQTEQDRVVAAQAADELLNISGISASFVFYPTAGGGVTVSGRSIGDVNVQLILERLGGGGNQSAAGAQMKNISLQDAKTALYTAIDDFLRD